MNGAAAGVILGGFVLGLIFVAVNVSVAFEVASAKNRSGTAWGLFSFLFPVVGPFLAYLLPTRSSRP